jgi:hypothetical protein
MYIHGEKLLLATVRLMKQGGQLLKIGAGAANEISEKNRGGVVSEMRVR